MDNTESYKTVANGLIKEGILSSNQIYYYDKNPLKKVYEDVFRWCQDDLILDNERYQLPNSKFIFINDGSVNAFAHYTSSHQLIGMHTGLFEAMFDSFFGNYSLFSEPDFIYFEQYLGSIKMNGPSFMFTMFTRFIFFHELAHLLQGSKVGALNLMENVTKGDNTSTFNQQLREFDADNLGATQVYIQTSAKARINLVEDSEFNKQRYQSFIILGIASIFVFFLKISGYHVEFYREGKSHPHPLVRLGYIIRIPSSNPMLAINIRDKNFA